MKKEALISIILHKEALGLQYLGIEYIFPTADLS